LFLGGHITASRTQPGQSKKDLRHAGLIVLFAALLSALVLLVFGIQNWSTMAKARKLKNPFPPTPQALADGMQVYTNHCRSCHGQYGDGKGEKAAQLSVAPGDLTNASKMSRLTDGELYWQTTYGRRPMPAFKDKLTEQQRWEVVDYIRTFAEK
jgi:mono/diheme cytochrome c family protein